MSAQSNDSLLTRFASFTWGMVAIFSFGVAALVIAGFYALCSRGDTTFYDGRGEDRIAARDEIVAAQSTAMKGLTPALKRDVLNSLKASKPTPSKVPVPGTPAAIQLMEQQAKDAKEAAAAAPVAEKSAPGAPGAEDAAAEKGAAQEAK